MKKLLNLLVLTSLICLCMPAGAQEACSVWRVVDEAGVHLTDIAEEPAPGDTYITADNHLYEILRIDGATAIAAGKGLVTLPEVDWLDADAALPVTAMTRRIALYCTHSDECYEPSDGTYTTNDRGSVYQVAEALATSLQNEGVEAVVADTIHHPHDAGAYRRSRQTAVQLLREQTPDCLLDIHRDGIPDPESYAVTLSGKPASRIRLLVGRGNQNAEVNKEFALLVKAVADRVYPGLIKDIYMGKGVFNQDLLPRSLLLECGTYTLDKARVLNTMPLMAEVLDRALYGGVMGSAGRTISDVSGSGAAKGGITQGEADAPLPSSEGDGSGRGLLYVVLILAAGLIGYAVLSAGSWRRGMHKAERHMSEMTGGLIGRKPAEGEDHEHS